MATRARRSVLTMDQQKHVRANLMNTASSIATQLGDYVTKGQITIAGRVIELTSERLQAWRMVLDRTVPTLSATEITHKSGLESMDSAGLISRLTELARQRPELAAKLQEAIGGKVIEQQAESKELVVVESREDNRSPASESLQPAVQD